MQSCHVCLLSLSFCALPHALPSATSLVYKCRNGPKVVTGTDCKFNTQNKDLMGVVTYEVHILSLNTETLKEQ